MLAWSSAFPGCRPNIQLGCTTSATSFLASKHNRVWSDSVLAPLLCASPSVTSSFATAAIDWLRWANIEVWETFGFFIGAAFQRRGLPVSLVCLCFRWFAVAIWRGRHRSREVVFFRLLLPPLPEIRRVGAGTQDLSHCIFHCVV